MVVSSRTGRHIRQSDAKGSRQIWRQHAVGGSYGRMSVGQALRGTLPGRIVPRPDEAAPRPARPLRARLPDHSAAEERAMSIPLPQALVFDVFGTVVDWRGSIAAEGARLARAWGLATPVDWAAFADARCMVWVRRHPGQLPLIVSG